MGISVSFGRRLRAAVLAFTLASAPLLAACAARAHAGISPAPGGAGPELQAPRQNVSVPGGREGDRGYRAAERVFAAAVDIRGNQRNYLGRIVGRPESVFCVAPQRCTYRMHFDISIGEKTRLTLFLSLNRSAFGVVDCDEAHPGDSCEISAFVFDVGDEMSPHCVRVDPVRRAAGRHGWRVAPYLDPPNGNVTQYSRSDDNRIRLFIRTLEDNACLRSIYITRSVAA